MASRSCSAGSCGNGCPLCSATISLNRATSARRAPAGTSASVVTPACAFASVQRALEQLAVEAEDDVAEDGEEPPIAVPGEPLVLAPARQPVDGLVVQAEIEHGVHHARHGHPGAGPHRHQEGSRGVPEPGAGRRLEPGQALEHLGPESRRLLLAARHVRGPGLGGDREAGRHRDVERRHLEEAGPLAAEEFAQRGRRGGGPGRIRVAVPERVHVSGRTGARGGPSGPGSHRAAAQHSRVPHRHHSRARSNGPRPERGEEQALPHGRTSGSESH